MTLHKNKVHALVILALSFIIYGCGGSPSEGAIQTAIAQTGQAEAASVTDTPAPPTDIPTATNTEDLFRLTMQSNQTQNAGYQLTANAIGTSIALTPPTATKLPTATTAPKRGTRTNPFVAGETALLTKDEDIEFLLTISEILRGDSAYQFIRAANQFNDPPIEGYEYVVFRVLIEYTGPDKGALQLDEGDWSSVTLGRVFDWYDTSTCCMDPEFDLTLFAGGQAEGMVALLVAIDDPAPLLVIGMDSSGEGGIYFVVVADQ